MKSFFCFFKLLIVCVSGTFLFGCAGLETETEYLTSGFPEPQRRGVYHKVYPGETIWRIAKTYGVSLEDVIQTNNIPNVAKIEENQLIFIPGAHSLKEIIVDADEDQNEFTWPIKGKVINYFGQFKGRQLNKGIDILAQRGETVQAARTGHVVFADYLAGYGYTVILEHSDGYHTVYANNARIIVKLGELVLKRNEIAKVGSKNNLAYLHFQIRRNSVEDNPLHYLP